MIGGVCVRARARAIGCSRTAALAFSRVIRAFSRVARATRSNVFLPRHAFRHTGARPFLDTGTRPLLDTDTRLCLGERSVARCRRAADPGRRAVDRQPRRETLMRLPVAAPVGAAVIPGTSRIVARPV